MEKFLNIKNVKYIEISTNISELIERVVYFTESYNPSIISNGVGTFLLSKEAKKDNLKIVLTGDGADEVFCGYSICKENPKYMRKNILDDLEITELRKIDNISMAHSIELRNPFLDRIIIAFANNLKRI